METQLGPLPRGASRVRGQPRPPHTPAACSSDRATPWTPHRLLTTSPRIVAFTPRRRAPESTSHAPAPREAPDQRSGARARQAPRPGDAGSSRRLPEPAAPAPRTSACCVRAVFPAPRCRTPLLPRPSKSAHLFCFGGLELNPNYPSRPLPPLRLRGRQLPATPAPWSPGPSPRALLRARCSVASPASEGRFQISGRRRGAQAALVLSARANCAWGRGVLRSRVFGISPRCPAKCILKSLRLLR